MKNFIFLYIEPFVYIRVSGNGAFLYNNLNQENLIIKNEPITLKMILILSKLQNNRLVSLKPDQLEDIQFKNFIKLVKKKLMGDLIYLNNNIVPITFSPFIKLHDAKKMFTYLEIREINKMLKNDKQEKLKRLMLESEIGDNVISTITKLNIFINNNHSIRGYMNIFKQQLFPYTNSNKTLDIEIINKLFKDSISCFPQMNFIGNSFSDYSSLLDLSELIDKSNNVLNLYCHYTEDYDLFTIDSFQKCHKFVWITFPIQITILKKKIISGKLKNKFTYLFPVKSEIELDKVLQIIEETSLSSYKIIPVYQDNIGFCVRYSSYSEKYLLKNNISEKHIYINQILNRLNFGSLSILNDGTVYANFNDEKLGKIQTSSLKGLAFNELMFGESWKRTRHRIKKCEQCLYTDICPPISNFELVSQKFDYCKDISSASLIKPNSY